MTFLLTEISSIINSTFDFPLHSFRDNLPAILNNLLFFFNKYAAISLSTELNAIVFMLNPALSIRIDLICFSLIILLLTTFKFSIANFGSGLPDPKGANK